MDLQPCEKAIKEEIARCRLKRNKDVTELYLANKDLQNVSDLDCFQNLQLLWLNSNKLLSLDFLRGNLHLSELYLHGNRLVSVTGALHHLTSLRVLFLHKNQLQKLTLVVKELSKMQSLENLNLFHNPLAQEADYRHYVIYNLPSVKLLDRQEVLQSERYQSRVQYDEENELVRNSIAFGRHSEGPPSICYPRPLEDPGPTESVDFEVGNNFYRNNPPYANEEQAIAVRAVNRSIMEYTNLDWPRVPRAEQRRLASKAFDSPQMVTTRFR